jgi:hypothetical protein
MVPTQLPLPPVITQPPMAHTQPTNTRYTNVCVTVSYGHPMPLTHSHGADTVTHIANTVTIAASTATSNNTAMYSA